MKYDFTTILDRRGKDAVAADVIPFPGAEVKEGFDKILMWVADMSFATAPSIVNAMKARLENPTFGYFRPTDAYFDAIINWQKTRNNAVDLTREDIGYENGVLGGVACAVNAFTAPGECILLHSPTYIGFTGTIESTGRKIIHSDLYLDENNVWRMNYEDMEEKIKANKIHLAIFCTPHNPTGRVWTQEEVEKAFEIYKRNDCIVVCDEIWSDLLMNGSKHIAPQTISEDAKQRTISIYAPSKTFSLAGLIGSYHIIYNKYLRDRMDKQAAQTHYNSLNVMSMHALIGAYSEEGAEWLAELNQVLSDNVNYACDFIEKNLPGVKTVPAQGTYMLYLDCEEWCKAHDTSLDDLLLAGYSVGVIWQDGRPFHRPYAIRLNLALPHSRVIEAFDRLKKYVF